VNRCFIFLSLLAMLPGCTQTKEAKPLRWGADADGGMPYAFKDPADPSKMIGFEVDLANALAKEMNRPIEFTQYPFDKLADGLVRGDLDFAMNGLEIRPDLQRKVDFTRPYYVYKLQLVVRADEHRFSDFEDVKNGKSLVIGTLEGSAAERVLDKWKIKKKSYGDQEGPFQDLLKENDGVFLDLPVMRYYAKNDPMVKYARRTAKFKFAGEAIEPGVYAIAVSKNNKELKNEFNQAMLKLVQDGELQRIYKQWHIWNDDQKMLDDLEKLKNVVGYEVEADSSPMTFGGFFPHLCEGAVVTVQISVASMALAIVLGLAIALCRLYAPRPVQLLAIAYVEFFRGIPVLLLLYFLYFTLPDLAGQYHLPFDLKLSAWWAGVIGFGLNYAAYEAEIYRAGIGSIPHGQWEAAAALGLSNQQTFRRIILPQAIRVILPPMTSDFVALFKDTSVVSVIAVVELNKQYQILTKSGADIMQVAMTTAALYLIMSVPLGYASRYLEKRWGTKG
jgi:polar amino acid transport system substrate-binding protein